MFHDCKHWPIICPSSSEPTNGAKQWNLVIIVMTADGWCAYWCNKGHNYRSNSNLHLHENIISSIRVTINKKNDCWNCCCESRVGFTKMQKKKKTHTHQTLNYIHVSKYALKIYINKHISACSKGRARHRSFNQLDLRCLYLVWSSQPVTCINDPIRSEDGWRGARMSASVDVWIEKPIWDLESSKRPLIKKMT